MFINLKSLQILNLQHNIQSKDPLEKYPTAISEIHSLTALSLDGIDNALFDSAFKNLHQLENLTLSGVGGNCFIQSLESDFFSLQTPFLRDVDISGCNFHLDRKWHVSIFN